MFALGLAGAHRVGKTTLAQVFAEAADLRFVRTSSSELIKAMGFDINAHMSLQERLVLQAVILDDAHQKYLEAKPYGFVTDRTPLDMLAYTMSEITQERANELANSPGLSELMTAYVDRCFKVANECFDSIVVIQPGIKVVDDKAKVTAPTSEIYIEKINSIIIAQTANPKLNGGMAGVLKRGINDLDDRIAALVKIYMDHHQRHMEKLHNNIATSVASSIH